MHTTSLNELVEGYTAYAEADEMTLEARTAEPASTFICLGWTVAGGVALYEGYKRRRG